MRYSFNTQDEIINDDTECVKILIVDDLQEKLLVYETILTDLGQNLIMASSGEAALKLVLQHDFAVILLDVNMPGLDGFETAKLIHGRKKSAHTPIIFLTASNDEPLITQGYASGGVDYLPVPIIPEILRAKVKVFIELFQMRKQAASQAKESARRIAAEEADRRKDEFMCMLAHELRNPLAPIRNATQLLQLIGPKDPQLEQLRDIVDRQVKHMSRLIDDLLDTTRLSNGQILLRKERCDLVNIVRQTAEDYKSIFDNIKVHLEVNVPDAPLWISGDQTRLIQSIGNLLHNAHKFTEPGGIVSINLKNIVESQMAEIIVRDSGIGIEPKILPYIFDVFRQAEQGLDRNRGGLGLGLSLVKGLVKLHNGDVSVVNHGINKGAEFIIRIPVEPFLVLETSCRSINLSKDKFRILVIEDNKDAAETVKLLLNHYGHDVQIAYSRPEGLKTAQSFLPQIILCDIGLPGMDGYQVAAAIRQDPILYSTYIVAITGYDKKEDKMQMLQHGFNLYLTKPIDSNNLSNIIEQFTTETITMDHRISA
jgi:signal transduction histidine kinase